MSTTDDTRSTSTPDATLDPAMLAEVEQALNTVHADGDGNTGDGGIPVGEIVKPGTVAQLGTATKKGGGVAQPNGGIPVGEVITLAGGGTEDTGGIPVGEIKHQGGVAQPHGGIPHGETVRPS
jgi:hypothetical protein